MVDLTFLKQTIEEYYSGKTYGSMNHVFTVFNEVPKLIEEIEQLRQDLKEMYALTVENKNVHSR